MPSIVYAPVGEDVFRDEDVADFRVAQLFQDPGNAEDYVAAHPGTWVEHWDYYDEIWETIRDVDYDDECASDLERDGFYMEEY